MNKKSKSDMEMLNEFFTEEDSIALDKELAKGYDQAINGEGISSEELKKRLKDKEAKLKSKN